MNWGIIGCGVIAGNFAESIKALEGAELLAGASKTPGKAKAFAEKYGLPKWYSNYDELLADDSIEVVYVATTHNFHYESVRKCLEAGKHVLCEKVFTMNAEQAIHLHELAMEKRLFLMEAMWTRFLPATVALLKLIEDGVIGEVNFLKADFSFIAEKDLGNRFYNLELAGGALMDLGIYPLSFSHMIFGKTPERIWANGAIAASGVDTRSSFLLDFGEGKAAQCSCNINLYPSQDAVIGGTKGWIDVPDFFCSQSFSVHIGNETTTYEYPYVATGKYHEAAEVIKCIKVGMTESNLHPMAHTIEIMKCIDEIKSQIGLIFPESMEKINYDS